MCPSLEPTVSPAPRYDMHHGIWTGPRSGPPSGQLGVLCAGLVVRVSLHGTIIPSWIIAPPSWMPLGSHSSPSIQLTACTITRLIFPRLPSHSAAQEPSLAPHCPQDKILVPQSGSQGPAWFHLSCSSHPVFSPLPCWNKSPRLELVPLVTSSITLKVKQYWRRTKLADRHYLTLRLAIKLE